MHLFVSILKSYMFKHVRPLLAYFSLNRDYLKLEIYETFIVILNTKRVFSICIFGIFSFSIFLIIHIVKGFVEIDFRRKWMIPLQNHILISDLFFLCWEAGCGIHISVLLL